MSFGEVQARDAGVDVRSYLMIIQCAIAVVMMWLTSRPRRFDMLSATYMNGSEKALRWCLTGRSGNTVMAIIAGGIGKLANS